MSRLFHRTTLLSLLVTLALGVACSNTIDPTIAPGVDTRHVALYDGESATQRALTIDNGGIVDYANTFFSTPAATITDVDPDSLVAIAPTGMLSVGMQQALDGASIEAITPKLDANGKPLTAGFGDWLGSINLVDGFVPNNDVVQIYYFDKDGNALGCSPAAVPPPDCNTTLVYLVPGYAPGGGVPVDNAASIADVPPPAFILVPNPDVPAIPSGTIVFAHLIAGEKGLKGISGLNMEAANDAEATPQPIVLSDGRKVGATFVFKIE